MDECLKDGFLDPRLRGVSISMDEAVEIYRSGNQAKIAELVAIQENSLGNDEVVKIVLEEIEALQEPDRSVFLEGFTECNTLIKFGEKGYPKEYIYVVYRSSDYKEAEKRIGRLGTAADLGQYFVTKGMEFLFTSDEFRLLFDNWLKETGLVIPDKTKEMLIEKYDATHFLFTMFMDNFEGLTRDFVDRFQQFRYSLIRNRLFNKKN